MTNTTIQALFDAAKTKANTVVRCVKWDGKLVFRVKDIDEDIVFDPDMASAENRARAMIHGFTQRISDGAAISRDTDTGASATPQQKWDKMKSIADHYMSGGTDWNLKVAVGGLDAGLTIQAIMAVFGKTLDEVEAILAKTIEKKELKDRAAALAYWAKTDKVALKMVELKTERPSTIDSDDLMDEIMD